MTWLWLVVSFFAGTINGVVIMCLLQINRFHGHGEEKSLDKIS